VFSKFSKVIYKSENVVKKIIIIILFLSTAVLLNAQQKVKSKIYLSGAKVLDISSDGENIWFATEGSGIYQYNLKKKKWRAFSTSRGNITQNYFYCITANKNFVWAGSVDGLYTYDKRTNRWYQRKFAKGGQLSNWIRSIKYDKYENAVWIGRFMYLTKYDIRKHRFYDFNLTRKGNEKTNTITTIAIDGDSLVWFGTEGGLQRYDKSKHLNNSSAITFYDNSYNYFLGQGEMISISAILFDRNYLWIGTDEFITKSNPDFNLGGLYRFNRKNQWLRFGTNQGLAGNGIYSLALIGKYIWVSLYQFGEKYKEKYGRGVAVINRTNFQITMLQNKVIPSTVYKIFFDGKYVWLGGNNGVVRIDLLNKFSTSFSKKLKR